jgi:hypothetical protein
MRHLLPLALLLAATLSGCIGSGFTQAACSPASAELTGDLSTDVVGSWEGFGIDSRLVYLFRDDGSWSLFEPPNVYAAGGLRSDGTWSAEGEGLSVQWPSGDEPELWDDVELTEDELRVTITWQEGDEEYSDTREWTRACCSGAPGYCP